MTPSSTAEPPIEVESALVVRADQPAEVLAKIAALRTLARWTLEPLTPQTIEDVYFDASDGSLGARRIAVRVRRVDGQVLLALKSGLRREGDVTTRIEIEAPWSQDVLGRVVGEFETLGVPQGTQVPNARATPEAALGELGLHPIQRRSTRRERRAMLDASGANAAELALDAVSFELGGAHLRLYEVEVEARAEDAAIGAMVDALVDAFPALRPWPYAKLATGHAAARALAEGSLAVPDDGTLTPTALDVLGRALAR